MTSGSRALRAGLQPVFLYSVSSYPWPPWLPLSVVPHPPTPGTFRAAAALIYLHLSLSHWQPFLVYWICFHSAMCFPNLQNPNTVLSSFFSFTFLCDCLYFFFKFTFLHFHWLQCFQDIEKDSRDTRDTLSWNSGVVLRRRGFLPFPSYFLSWVEHDSITME